MRTPSKRKAIAPRKSAARVQWALIAVALAGTGLALFGLWRRLPNPPARVVAEATPAPARPPAMSAPAPSPPPEPATPPYSAALEAAFDAWLIDAYRRCWTPPKTLPEGDPYFAKVRVAFKAGGALAALPKLVNPPFDPAWRPQAEAALRAVRACDPLHVPEKYAPYYLKWKTKTVYFDPARP